MSLARSFEWAVLTLLLAAISPLARADTDAEVRAAVARSLDAMVEKGAFRVESTTEAKGGTQRSVVEVVWPDRFRIRSLTQGTEFVSLPGATWMKQGGAWMRMPIDVGAMTKVFTEQAMRDGLATIENAEVLGSEDVAGRSARVYAYDQTATVMGIRSETRVKAWIDAASDLVLRTEIDGEALGQRSRTINVYDWDAPVTIEPPQ